MTDDKKTIEALPEIAPGEEDIASFRRSSRIEAPKQSKFNGLLVFTIVVMATSHTQKIIGIWRRSDTLDFKEVYFLK